MTNRQILKKKRQKHEQMSLIYAVHQTAVTHQTSQTTASVSSECRQITECGGAAAKNKQIAD